MFGYVGTLFDTFAKFFKWYVTSGKLTIADSVGREAWGRYDARLARYRLYWANYEGNAYDDEHTWVETYKTLYGLYRWTRGIYNPSRRIVEFHATHLMGGTYDPECGDGKERPSCLPILTANPSLRPALATLWRDSVWQVNKDVYTRLGACLGDIGLKAIDDPVNGKMAIEVVHPGTVEDVQYDRWGNVTSYILRELRIDPRIGVNNASPQDTMGVNRQEVEYVEYCWLDNASGRVHYATYLGNELYPWNGVTAEWSELYTFIPFVLHRHIQMHPRIPWGQAEIHPGLPKMRNLDDVASKLHDQIRKAVDPKWFITGVSNPALTGRTAKSTNLGPTTDNPQPGRQELEAFYGGLGATVNPMVFPLDIQFSSIEVQNALNELERDYPELRYDRLRATGDASAKALREVRKAVEYKIHTLRARYDDSLVQINKMAIAIGGMRGYPGYEGFGLDSFRKGDLDHQIGIRSVFNQDPLDHLEEETALWNAAILAKQAGCPLAVFLERQGWSEEQIRELQSAQQDEQQKALEMEAARAELQPKALEPPKPKEAA